MSDAERPNPLASEDFENLFAEAPCGYLSIDPLGYVVSANGKIAQWTGMALENLVGRRIHDLLSVPTRIFYETNVSPLLRLQGSVDEIAMDFRASDGSKIQCLVNAAERRNGAHELMFTRLAVFRATARRRYERALIDANDASERAVAAERENSHLREQFIAVLGHDLRNPLASISSGVRLLTKHETVSDRGRQVLTLMQGSVLRASEMIDNVLDFARGRLGGGMTLARDSLAPLTPVLRQVISELSSVNPTRDIRVNLAIAEPVDCDRVRIGQLLSNLLGNALTHGSKHDPVFVEARTDDDTLVVAVSNGGDPIDRQTMERLFQPFFRGDLEAAQIGLGLGLHIASEIAKAHGGVLRVDSDRSETRFTFTMPLIRPPSPAA